MKRTLSAVLLATGVSGMAFYGWAQSQPAMHGFGDPLGAIAKVKAQLGLNAAQQQQWDAALAQGKAARQAARSNFGELRTATQTELAKPEPDLASLAALADDIQQQNATLRKATRSAWLALYATFTPEQKAIARDAIKAKLDRMAAFRAHLRERLGG